MRFIRSRFGIVLWCAIALLILIVPLWRLRATRQWSFASIKEALAPDYISSPILAEGQPEPTRIPIPYGVTDADEAAAWRRFPAEPVAQLANLDYHAMNSRVHDLNRGITQNYADARSLASAQARSQAINPRVRAITDRYYSQYDALERRFPKSVLVRAQHLREVSSQTFFSDPATDEITQTPGDYWLKSDSWVSKNSLGDAIKAARQGARLRPDNAYFPWMEAVFQFELERPSDALRALEAAARCSKFDDFTFENIEERTRLLQRLRATGWEDDVAEQGLALFPHYSRMRAVARAASWQMQLARKRQDKAAAYRWAAALARASYPVARDERNSIITVLVGEAICKIGWSAAVKDRPNAPKSPVNMSGQEREAAFDAFNEANVALFADLARENGDDDLAQQTLSMAASLNARELVKFAQTDPGGLESLNYRLSVFYWLGAQLLRIALGGALTWLVCWPLTRRLPVARTRAKMLLPAMFCAGVSSAILVGAALFAPSLYGLLSGFYEYPGEDKTFWAIAILRDRWPLMLGLLWGVLVVGGALVSASRAQNETEKSSLRPWLDVILWAGAVLCLTPIFYFYPDFKPANFAGDFTVYGAMLALLALSGVASFTRIRRAAGLKRVLTVCLIGLFWMGFMVPLLESLLFPGALSELFWFATLLWFARIACAVGALVASAVLLMRGMKAVRVREIAVQIVARARIAAGVLALLGALAYLGIALWSIPVESRARAIMGRQLQVGGVAWLREQAARRP